MLCITLFNYKFNENNPFFVQVYIAAHVPPGTFELAPSFKWFHEDLNHQFLDIIDNYNDIIVAHFYGHEHTDSFRLYDATGMYCNVTIEVDFSNQLTLLIYSKWL